MHASTKRLLRNSALGCFEREIHQPLYFNVFRGYELIIFLRGLVTTILSRMNGASAARFGFFLK